MEPLRGGVHRLAELQPQGQGGPGPGVVAPRVVVEEPGRQRPPISLSSMRAGNAYGAALTVNDTSRVCISAPSPFGPEKAVAFSVYSPAGSGSPFRL